MAKKSLIEKEKKKKELVFLFSERRKEALSKIKNASNMYEKIKASFIIQKYPRNSSKIRLRNRCEITGRPRGFYRFFKLSRNQIRVLACKSFLPGVHKSSW